MSYPLDHEKWTRLRRAMAENDLDAVIVRAPDNILYLTNYWTMKGYEIAVFPREGEPTLCRPRAAIARSAAHRLE